MPIPRIRREKISTDQIGRRLNPGVALGCTADGLVVAARGGAIQGPVGEF